MIIPNTKRCQNVTKQLVETDQNFHRNYNANTAPAAKIFKNFFMLLAVRVSSYGCTWEVWRAREKRKSCSRRSREQL